MDATLRGAITQRYRQVVDAVQLGENEEQGEGTAK